MDSYEEVNIKALNCGENAMRRRDFAAVLVGALVAPAPLLAADMKILAAGHLRSGVHEAHGTVEIVGDGAGARLLRFTDFEVLDGPDLKVWLVKAAGVGSAADVVGSEHQSLGALKAATGNQDYVIPASVDPLVFRSVVVWCEQFSVLFAAAELMPPS